MLWLVRLLAVRLHGWRRYMIILVVAFLAAWGLMVLFEPPRAAIYQPRNY